MFHLVRIKPNTFASTTFSLKQSKWFNNEVTRHSKHNTNTSHVQYAYNLRQTSHISAAPVFRTHNVPNTIFGKRYYYQNFKFENFINLKDTTKLFHGTFSNSNSNPIWLLGLAFLSLFWFNNQDVKKSDSVLDLALEASAAEQVALRATHQKSVTPPQSVYLLIRKEEQIFSEEFCDAMSKLHNQCPTHSYQQTREVIERTLGQSIEGIFKSFDVVPLASGAIAQVHKATLKDGTEVAVKVRHPNSAPSVAIDLAILDTASRVITWLPRMEYLSLIDAVEQFSTSMSRQLNLFTEAQHLLRFRENFRDIQEVIFPKPFLQYSSKAVLVESFERGLPVSKFFLTDKEIQLNRVDPKKNPFPAVNHILAQIGLNAYMKMMLLDFFVHADLHPGNILVQLPPEPQQHNKKALPKLVFLDVGLVAEFTDDDSKHFVELFKAIVKGDGVYGTELMIKYSKVPPKFKNKEQEEEFKQKMAAVFASVREKKLSQVDVGEFLGNVLNLMRTYRVTIEGSFATLVVGTVVLEGIGRRLDPDINLLELSVPFLFKAAPHAFLPWKIW